MRGRLDGHLDRTRSGGCGCGAAQPCAHCGSSSEQQPDARPGRRLCRGDAISVPSMDGGGPAARAPQKQGRTASTSPGAQPRRNCGQQHSTSVEAKHLLHLRGGVTAAPGGPLVEITGAAQVVKTTDGKPATRCRPHPRDHRDGRSFRVKSRRCIAAGHRARGGLESSDHGCRREVRLRDRYVEEAQPNSVAVPGCRRRPRVPAEQNGVVASDLFVGGDLAIWRSRRRKMRGGSALD